MPSPLGVRYRHTSGGIAVASVEEATDRIMVEAICRLPFAEIQVFAVEEFFASLMVYGRALAGPDFKPQAVEFMHAAPSMPSNTSGFWDRMCTSVADTIAC